MLIFHSYVKWPEGIWFCLVVMFFSQFSPGNHQRFPSLQKWSVGGSQSRGDPPTEKLQKMMTSSGNYTVDICSYQFSIYQSINLYICTGWWFGIWLDYDFPFRKGNGKIIPTDEVHHFSEGQVYHQPVLDDVSFWLTTAWFALKLLFFWILIMLMFFFQPSNLM